MTLAEFIATHGGQLDRLDTLWELKFRMLCTAIGAHAHITREDLTAEATMELRRATIALLDTFNELNAAGCQAILAGRDARHPTEADWRAAVLELRGFLRTSKRGRAKR
jgi:hypothetical protein